MACTYRTTGRQQTSLHLHDQLIINTILSTVLCGPINPARADLHETVLLVEFCKTISCEMLYIERQRLIDIGGCCWIPRKHADGCSLCLSFTMQIYISTVVHSLSVCVCVGKCTVYGACCTLCSTLNHEAKSVFLAVSLIFVQNLFFLSYFLIEDVK